MVLSDPPISALAPTPTPTVALAPGVVAGQITARIAAARRPYRPDNHDLLGEAEIDAGAPQGADMARVAAPSAGLNMQPISVTEPTMKLVVEPRHSSTPTSTRD